MASFEQDPTEDTGIKDLTPRGNSEVTRARERKANAALELAMANVSWDEIAKGLGYPDGKRAQAAVELALEKGVFTSDSQEILRNYAVKRLERLSSAVWRQAIDPEYPDQLAYHAEALRVVDRWIKLLGLDAPQQHVVSSPSMAQLQTWVDQAIALKQPALPEVDIFELESSDWTEKPEAG